MPGLLVRRHGRESRISKSIGQSQLSRGTRNRPAVTAGLPAALLEKIFLHVVCQPCVDPATALMAEVLAQVCTRWRWVSLQLPSLWSTLFLTTTGPHSSLQRLCEYMDRAGPRVPLDIFVEHFPAWRKPALEDRDDPNQKVPERPLLQTGLNMLVTRVHNWRRFSFSCDRIRDLTKCLATLADVRSMPRLETLEVHYDGSGSVMPVFSFMNGGVPRLRAFNCRHIFLSQGPTQLILSVTELSFTGQKHSLMLDSSTLVAFTDMLRACPNLETLALGSFHRKDDLRAPLKPEVVLLNKLKSLTLSSSSFTDFAQILKYISFGPRLRFVAVEGAFVETGADPDLFGILQRVLPLQSIQHLRLCLFDAFTQSLYDFFCALPNVTRLDAHLEFSYPLEQLECVCRQPHFQPGMPCRAPPPKLRALALRKTGEHEYAAKVLADALASRRAHGYPVSELYVARGDMPLVEQKVERLRKAVTELVVAEHCFMPWMDAEGTELDI